MYELTKTLKFNEKIFKEFDIVSIEIKRVDGDGSAFCPNSYFISIKGRIIKLENFSLVLDCSKEYYGNKKVIQYSNIISIEKINNIKEGEH